MRTNAAKFSTETGKLVNDAIDRRLGIQRSGHQVGEVELIDTSIVTIPLIRATR